MNEQFIVALRNHRKLGYILAPFIAAFDEQRGFWTVKAPVAIVDIEDETFHPDEKKVVQIAHKYSDSEIFRHFGRRRKAKTGSVQEFYNQLSDEDIQKKIRPYVEKHLAKLVDHLRRVDIPVFLKDRKYDNLYESDRLTLHADLAETVFHFVRDEAGIKYSLSVYHRDQEKVLNDKFARLLCTHPAVLLLEDEIFMFSDIDGNKLKPFFYKDYVQIKKQDEERYFNKFVRKTIREYRVHASGFSIQETKPEKKTVLHVQKGLDNTLVLDLEFLYGHNHIKPNNKQRKLVIYAPQGEALFTVIRRDFSWEERIGRDLQKLGLTPAFETAYRLEVQGRPASDYETIAWINAHAQKLDELGIALKQHLDTTYFLGYVLLETQLQEKTDWFDIYALVLFGDYEIPFYKLRNHILNGWSEYKLPDGTVVILPEAWFAEYREILALAEGNGRHMYLKKHHFPLLHEELGTHIKPVKARFEQLLQETPDQDVQQPGQLRAKLRKYQHQGFSWLYFLYRHQFGGCLADDMGLGKTLQAITMLLKAREEYGGNGEATQAEARPQNGQLSLFGEDTRKNAPASLIVMPTSLLHNWQNELRKFAPHLNVIRYVGNREGKIHEFDRYDIVLTSYGIVRNDYEELSSYRFFFIVLDESQNIKNPGSKTFKAVSELEGDYKVVLTGTPIENTLTDLWTQFNFLNEGILGSFHYFREHFVNPIERFRDEEKEKQLQALIQPFLLRRKKSDVAPELPPVSEQTYFCELTPEQRELYETHKSRIRNQLLEDLSGYQASNMRMWILKSLTELRQLSNHPRMLYKGYEGESGKFNEIARSIENIVSEGHKVVIFSSFVKHLHLIEEYLDNQAIPVLKLTGSTPDREEVIEKFQEQPQYPVFLISLKAGGVGLNLTAAGYVFIVDPWWNPAAEQQAIDRTHRIGQDKKVFVYRFITHETIEEKIQGLQRRKRQLADDFVNFSDPLKSLSIEEIRDLFQ